MGAYGDVFRTSQKKIFFMPYAQDQASQVCQNAIRRHATMLADLHYVWGHARNAQTVAVVRLCRPACCMRYPARTVKESQGSAQRAASAFRPPAGVNRPIITSIFPRRLRRRPRGSTRHPAGRVFDTAILETPSSFAGNEKKIQMGFREAWGLTVGSWAFRDTMGHVRGPQHGGEMASDVLPPPP